MALLLFQAGIFAQKNISGFFELEANSGNRVSRSGEEAFLSAMFINKPFFPVPSGAREEPRNRIAYGIGFKGGVNVKGRWQMGAGIRFQGRSGTISSSPFVICDCPEEPFILLAPFTLGPGTMQLNLLEFPVHARFNLFADKPFTPFLSVEGYRAIALNRLQILDLTGGRLRHWGYAAGLGAGYAVGRKMMVDFQFYYDRSDSIVQGWARYHYREGTLGFKVGTGVRF